MADMISPIGDGMAYVKAIDVTDLPKDVRDQAQGLNQLYAVHDASGQQLALVGDRKLAFNLARQNDYAPVMIQ